MSEHCICQICTCGKHHCPGLQKAPNVVAYHAPLLTEYRDNFTLPSSLYKSFGQKPDDDWQLSKDMITNTSTYRHDFAPHEMVNTALKVPMVHPPSCGNMMLTSTYTKDYKTHPLQKYMMKKAQQHFPMSKMASTTVYRDDFQPWGKEQFKTTNNQLNEWKHLYSSQGVSCKPPGPQTMESLPFYGTTEYQSQYVPYPAQSKLPGDETYWPLSSSLCDPSAYNDDYKGLPENMAHGTLSHRTTEFQDQFKPWSIQPKLPYKVNYSPIEGKMSYLSTTHADYTAPEFHQWPNTGKVDYSSYTRQHLGPCPASFAEPPGFEFICTKGGHNLYRPLLLGGTTTSRRM